MVGKQTANRKLEHLNIIQEDAKVDRNGRFFDQIQLIHRALPECNLADVDTSMVFLGKRLTFPMMISSMTGGDDELTCTINRNLAAAAEEVGVAMAVGSQRVMFSRPQAMKSFDLRTVAPTTVLCGNLGAVQLNNGYGIEECRKAVEILGADALYLHLNPLQEAVQPEGNTNFSELAARIGEIAAGLEKPVIIKEVGAGLSPEDVRRLIARGVRVFDVAGRGGTSWSRIEQQRVSDDADSLGTLFQDWGIPTPVALRLLAPMNQEVDLIASGGVRNGIDMAKAIILGALVCGMALPLLEPAKESKEAVVATLRQLHREFTTAMFLLGCCNVDELRSNQLLILE